MNKKSSITDLVKSKYYDDDKKKRGIYMHEYFENYLKKGIDPINLNDNDKKNFVYFKHFLNDFLPDKKNYCDIFPEYDISLEHNNHIFTGRIDLYIKNIIKKTNYIIDWKISKDINPYNFNDIKLTLNLYKYFILKNNENIEIEMYVVLLHEENYDYILHKIDDIKENFIIKTLNEYDKKKNFENK